MKDLTTQGFGICRANTSGVTLHRLLVVQQWVRVSGLLAHQILVHGSQEEEHKKARASSPINESESPSVRAHALASVANAILKFMLHPR